MKIVNFELTCNNWTNGMYEATLYVDTEELPAITEEVLFENPDHTYVFGYDETSGLMSYGVIQKHDGYGHKHTACIDIDFILPFLPIGFYIAELIELDINDYYFRGKAL